MIFVDCDNAMGSSRGDVDDAFALAAILRSGSPVAGVGSVAGNTTAERAWRNNRALAELCGYGGPVLRSAEVPPFLASLPEPLRYLALGPLTNLAASLAPDAPLPAEAIIVGGNLSSPGRWPPWFPFEFNLTKDARALRTVWESPLPLTLLPLDVARRMLVTRTDLEALHGPIGRYLRQNSSRWFTRSRLLKWSSTIPLYDLPAAIYAIDSDAAPITEQYADLHSNGWIDFRRGSRQVRVIRSFDRDRIWGRFLTVLGRLPSEGPARGSAARPGG